jgi:cytochrome c-type biogenesis protein
VSETASLFAALGAGFITFLSPCVLPLIPGYVAFMTGMTSAELSSSDRRTSQVLFPSLLFVLGFSIVFVALGASASAVGSFLSQYSAVLVSPRL